MITFKIEALLEQLNEGKPEKEKITKGAIAREAKVRPNVLYEMSENKTKRVEIETLNKIMAAINRISDKKVDICDVIEYIPDTDKE
ncbi:helix-turn-helix domain-containing protein [Brevibacillus panacihumi]|uniref:helix-turn-helix domain-containing protein n=1 Tax=Brevibacillus panacihumi TaxID=497735 RepID=UPI003D219EA5